MKNLTPYLKALKAFETAAMTALIAALRVAGGAWPIRLQSCQRILFLLKPACKAKVRWVFQKFFPCNAPPLLYNKLQIPKRATAMIEHYLQQIQQLCPSLSR